MDDQRPTTKSGGVLTVIVLCALFCAYIFAYTHLSKRLEFEDRTEPRILRYRVARYQWEADLFIPAVFVESRLRGVHIESTYQND
jgi:hypothetical protein